MKKSRAVCPYCGAGCKLKLVVDNNKIIRAEAADGVTNQNQLCLKGYYGWDFLNDTQLLTPRLKTTDDPLPERRRLHAGQLAGGDSLYRQQAQGDQRETWARAPS
ncbi:formate dehydrogenase H, selenopolypeptide subunit [Klebsiella pneumoniae]|uniref:Formate dehydrogenase H, selenopolypeptide subunit n=1 Tax=Klebsiella pneumoniae TaxID=573 RepID=A0A378H5C9_KLEPN|nr:formate dehydrogenase H, selenopolypeptide subunit [Klebsiella pneumoniae]